MTVPLHLDLDGPHVHCCLAVFSGAAVVWGNAYIYILYMPICALIQACHLPSAFRPTEGGGGRDREERERQKGHRVTSKVGTINVCFLQDFVIFSYFGLAKCDKHDNYAYFKAVQQFSRKFFVFLNSIVRWLYNSTCIQRQQLTQHLRSMRGGGGDGRWRLFAGSGTGFQLFVWHYMYIAAIQYIYSPAQSTLLGCFQSWARDNLFSFSKTTTRQRNGSSETRKKRNMWRSRCLNGVATTNTNICRPGYMVTLSRQCCRMPSSGFLFALTTDHFVIFHSQLKYYNLKIIILLESAKILLFYKYRMMRKFSISFSKSSFADLDTSGSELICKIRIFRMHPWLVLKNVIKKLKRYKCWCFRVFLV